MSYFLSPVFRLRNWFLFIGIFLLEFFFLYFQNLKIINIIQLIGLTDMQPTVTKHNLTHQEELMLLILSTNLSRSIHQTCRREVTIYMYIIVIIYLCSHKVFLFFSFTPIFVINLQPLKQHYLASCIWLVYDVQCTC